MKYYLVLLLCAAAFAAPGFRSFDGFKVYRLSITTQDQLNALAKFHEESDVDFWSHPKLNGTADIMASKEQAASILEFVAAHNIESSVMIDDVESLVHEQRDSMSKIGSTRIDWTNYHRHEAIGEWLNELAATHPNIASVVNIGSSGENRTMTLIKISTGGSGKPAIFLDGGFHAREWISVAVNTYVINELVTNSANYASLLNAVDFYVLPVSNPDGYTYSITNDRMWRKTRSNHVSICRGVDPNRNFGYQYGGAGTSPDKCSDIYRGPNAFSERETINIRDFILNTNANWRGYITIHSYGQYWLTPWGYAAVLPTDYTELKRVADIGAAALTAVHGTRYTVGTSAIALYPAAGGSDDWAKGGAGIKYSYTLELRDTGRFGFLLPANQIIPTSDETWAGIQAAVREISSAT